MERRMRLKIEEQAMAAQWKAQNVSFSQSTFIPNADGKSLYVVMCVYFHFGCNCYVELVVKSELDQSPV